MMRGNTFGIFLEKNEGKYGVRIESKKYKDFVIGDSYYLPCEDKQSAKFLFEMLNMIFKGGYIDGKYDGSISRIP